METCSKVLGLFAILGIQALFTWPITLASRHLFGWYLLAELSIYATALQIIVFIPSFLCRSEKLYDLTGSFTYISITLIATLTNLHRI